MNTGDQSSLAYQKKKKKKPHQKNAEGHAAEPVTGKIDWKHVAR